jgi:cell division protein ZapA
MSTLRIDVLGADFSIASKEDERYLLMLLKSYKNMVQIIEKNNARTSSSPDPLKTAILAGIMLCDELAKVKHEVEKLKSTEEEMYQNPELKEAERITLSLIDKIDRALV